MEPYQQMSLLTRKFISKLPLSLLSAKTSLWSKNCFFLVNERPKGINTIILKLFGFEVNFDSVKASQTLNCKDKNKYLIDQMFKCK